MDPLTIITSIPTLVDICKRCISGLKSMIDASKDCPILLYEITNLETLLQRLGYEKKTQNQDQTSNQDKDGSKSTTTSESFPVQALENHVKRMRTRMQNIERKLAVKDHRFGGLVKAVKWPFSENEVKDLLGDLERDKLLLNLLVQGDHLALSQALRLDVKDILMIARWRIFAEYFKATGSEEGRVFGGIEGVVEEEECDGGAANNVQRCLTKLSRWLTSRYARMRQISEFIIATLHMEALSELGTKGDIRRTLKDFSIDGQSLNSLYQKVMDRIAEQFKIKISIAHRLLAWLTRVRRPLSPGELLHAFAIREGDQEFRNDMLYGMDYLLVTCKGLVEVDRESNVVRLVHRSGEEDIAGTCLTYLPLNELQEQPADQDALQKLIDRYPFLQYSAISWGHHAKAIQHVTQEMEDKVLAFIQLPYRTSDILLEYWANNEATQRSLEIWKGERRASGLHRLAHHRIKCHLMDIHLAIFFRFTSILESLLSDDPKRYWKMKPNNPLCWAARLDRYEEMKIMIENGADVNAEGGVGWTPLHWTCICASLEVHNALNADNTAGLMIPIEDPALPRRVLDKDINPNQDFGLGRSKLDAAIQLRDSELISLCLEYGGLPKAYWTIEMPEIAHHSQEPCRDTPGKELYLELRVLGNSPPPGKIIFTITSHDQGWSSFPHDHGAYMGSQSFFAADVYKEGQNGDKEISSRKKRIIYNVHASK
ncbi:hypothetical protein BKA64DRAFT_723831 [Cadophora sp. MPI-SDFR-AT-0126]|nr:hypothetical protein BKA64DRAFT_723831 [Leotiomycetes sp. MPI-SDFR-AT-0126]